MRKRVLLLLLLLLLLLAGAARADDAKRLLDDDPPVRAAAATRLGDLASVRAVPLLAEATYDEDLLVARAAVDALGRIGPPAREAAPLLRRLAAARPALGAIVARALRSMGEGPGEPPAPPRPDETLLDDPRASVRMPAIWALAADPAADPLFLAMLGDPRVRRRRIAAEHAFAPESLPGLRRALADADPRVRRGVVVAIGNLGPRAEPALPDLLALLGDAGLADELTRAIASAGRGAPDTVVPALVRELASPHAACRSAACTALGSLGGDAAPAVPALVGACFDDEPQVRSDAVSALRALGHAAREAAPFLAEIADADPEGELARLALAAVGGGLLPPPPDPPDLASLAARLAGEDARAAGLAAFTLGRVGAKDAATVDALGAALGHAAPYARRHAALALLRLGPPGVPALARAASGPARRAAAAILPRLAAADPDAVLPVALAFLDDAEPSVRREASRALGILGPRARDAVPALLGCVRAEDAALADTAAWALGRMEATQALPPLLERLRRPVDESRAWTLMALAALGPAAEPALPALAAEARRPDDSHFGGALDALARIGTPGQAEIARLIRDETGLHRSNAMALLVALDARPPGLRLALDAAATDPDSTVRQAALLFASRLGPAEAGGEVALAKLVAAARAEPKDRFRWSSLPETLAEVAASRDLLAMVRDEDAQVRWFAWRAIALKRPDELAGGTSALPLLLEALADPKVADAAALAVHVMPLGPPEPALLRFLVPPAAKPRRGGRRPVSSFDAYVAEQVRNALLARGPVIVPALATALGHEDPRVRAGAAAVLAGFGHASRAAVPALHAAAGADPGGAEPFVKAIAAAAELETIAALFADTGTPCRAELGDALVAAGKDAMPLLDALRGHDEPAVRRDTVNLLARCPGVPTEWILSATADESDDVASAALAQLGPAVPAEKAIPALERAARDDALRTTALRVLVSRGAGAFPTLSALARDDNVAIRAAALGALGGSGAPAFDLLAEALKDGDPGARTAAASTLRHLGADAARAIPALRALLDDPDARVRSAAAATLGHLRVEEAMPDLVRLLGSAEGSDRAAAAEALAAFGGKGAEALTPFLGHADAGYRESVRSALARLGAKAVPALAAAMESGDAKARREAATLLAKGGAPAVVALRAALRAKEPAVRLDAAWALGTMKARAKAAVPDLVAALEDKDPLVVPQAAWALGQIGPAAAEALPALEKMHKARRHPAIVADAIRRIRGS